MNFAKTGRKFVKVGVEIIIFGNQGGKCSKTGKIGGGIQHLWSMNKKKRSSKFFTESKSFSKIGGN